MALETADSEVPIYKNQRMTKMKNTKKIEPFSWLVMHYDCNRNRIYQYDVLKYRENDIKKLKKKYDNKEDFAEALSREMHYYYWSKAEWELIIELTDNNHVWLSPWCGCRNPDDVQIDVTAREDFDWVEFAKKYIQYGNDAKITKIDVWDQLEFNFDDFVTYCWEYRHKWQRTNKKEENQ